MKICKTNINQEVNRYGAEKEIVGSKKHHF